MLLTLKRLTLWVTALVSALWLTSCDLINEYEGDCTTRYRVKFVYDMNLKWADAFSSEVRSVNLYLFGSDGLFVKQFAAAGQALSQPGFCIEFDENTVPPGDYTFIAWCGLVNDGVAMESFRVPEPVAGQTTMEELTCMLNATASRSETLYSDSQLKFLYHGMITANLPDAKDGNTYDYVIPLTKDTNHIRIILQELSGDRMDENDYEVSIEAHDGWLAYNNTLLPDNPTVVYTPWAKGTSILEITGENGLPAYNYGISADLSTSRMMSSHSNDFYLNVKDAQSNNEIIAKVPLIQYALLAKDYYNQAYGHNMDDQEFLDREDEYTITFFLYKKKWIDAYIDINSWRVVIHNYDL